jgi:D-beta-D-heptose 7-phosphate kinase/D-beta-D-heptose 1-phosphate adenosyltransferase
MDFAGLKITVVGDIIFDHWVFGRAERLSPEAPVPVFVEERDEWKFGGAANTKANLEALGVTAQVFGKANSAIKTRYICDRYQMFRVDKEDASEIDAAEQAELYNSATAQGADALILSDYGKGALTTALCKSLIQWANVAEIPIIVDPKGKRWAKYHGCTLITPNEREYAEWERDCEFPTILRTLGPKGVELIRGNELPIRIEANVRDVYDVVGAGDTICAVVAACLAKGLKMEDAAGIANTAAGVVVAKRGTATCTIEELNEALRV